MHNKLIRLSHSRFSKIFRCRVLL